MRRFLPLLLIAVLGAAVPVLAVSEPASDELEHNRRLLERYRADPDHYARLLRDLRVFQALPLDQQERMRQFDRDLHDQDPALQNQLWEVLERYTDWVNRLPEVDQRRIEQAADRNERLAVVKQLRQRDWIERLPKRDRDELLALPPGQQPARLAELRQKERQRRQEWADWAATEKGRPAALPAAPRNVLSDFARNELTPEDRARLHLRTADKAEKFEILKQEYFKRHPEALQKYRRN
ncbi:MAG TPA: hypothetical protein VMS17_17385 [Gemmataceae bacterium]|nr:hypothetical protein [Gemmataceae bacterium]